MSWGAHIYKLKTIQPPTTDAEWEGFGEESLLSLGFGHEVQCQIANFIPSVTWDEPRLGWFNRDDFTMWLSFHPYEHDISQIMCVFVNVYGGGDPVEALGEFCIPNGWSVFDSQIGEFIDWKNPSSESFEAWTKIRDSYESRMHN